jgi:hypothetical protein
MRSVPFSLPCKAGEVARAACRRGLYFRETIKLLKVRIEVAGTASNRYGLGITKAASGMGEFTSNRSQMISFCLMPL